MSIHRVQLRNLNSQRGSKTNTNRNLISYCYSVYENRGVGFIVFTKCWLEITHLHCAITLTANIYFADYSASPVKIIWQHGGKWNQQFMLVVELRVTDLWRVPLGWSCLDMQRQTRRDVKFISDRFGLRRCFHFPTHCQRLRHLRGRRKQAEKGICVADWGYYYSEGPIWSKKDPFIASDVKVCW